MLADEKRVIAMKNKSRKFLLERIEQQEKKRRKLAEHVLRNIKEMNEKQKTWVKQHFRQDENEK
jgi:hypothetical protein